MKQVTREEDLHHLFTPTSSTSHGPSPACDIPALKHRPTEAGPLNIQTNLPAKLESQKYEQHSTLVSTMQSSIEANNASLRLDEKPSAPQASAQNLAPPSISTHRHDSAAPQNTSTHRPDPKASPSAKTSAADGTVSMRSSAKQISTSARYKQARTKEALNLSKLCC
jgi:hypothetical protein